MTDFVVDAMQDTTQCAIKPAEVVGLSVANQACFALALLSPLEPLIPLKRVVECQCKLRLDAE
ncbi:type II toxin -antitoxin system TacA 1-like antitoxin [Azohydromonas australica]|uniref:type II toxin -antitoxin system TacA 1-like antitoxin n=1 Tax=Azohydromonas australica TaxID=364039 RepID=UPI000414A52E|nr:DUF1778 domain-containing protein [Azohydromonas australica]